MAKILISPLGVGGRFKERDQSDREYQEACYHIDSKPYPESRFVASVLYKHFKLDGIVFIGTVKSMWEEVYRFFSEKNSSKLDESYWLSLAEKIDQLNYNSPLDSLDLEQVRQVLGERSQCILINYGLNQDELWQNFEKIIKVIDSLEKGDEIYLDITHSFRSLSVFQFITMTFIKELLSEKEISIAGVYYGMLDVTRELGYTPIVDLNPLFELTSWVKGTYSLKNYGNGDLIAELLNNQGEGDLSSRIKQLSQAININDVTAIKQNSSYLKTALSLPIKKSPFTYIKGILDNFVQKFTRSARSESAFQLDLAEWYFENHRYATGYITLTEAIITYLCEINHKDIIAESDRNQMKNLLHHRDNKGRELAQLYFKVNPIRKSIAHALIEDTKKVSYSDAITNAKTYLQKAQRIFKTGTLGNLER